MAVGEWRRHGHAGSRLLVHRARDDSAGSARDYLMATGLLLKL
ncbi:hypothetical protein OU5_4582 [Pseudomonas mandelii JR-1]|uniref:Uncharacterized protein n=1 Tax=Pseudomonas mandelii JR-1 TaxID=1147786 RepID=A0A024EGD3_9PSED|nr:hypothetical protein OU5_4582 [Pseudomonas mandelii JR-1]